MRYQVAFFYHNFPPQNRQVCLCCVLVVLNILIVMLVFPIMKSRKSAVYGIVDLGGVLEGQDLTAELKRRTNLLLSASVLRESLKDLAAAGFHPRVIHAWHLREALIDLTKARHEPPELIEEEWLRENVHMKSLDNPRLVRVELADCPPSEQVIIINALLRAYIRYFEAEEKKDLNNWISELESRNKSLANGMWTLGAELAKLSRSQAGNASPNWEWRTKLLKEAITKEEERYQQTAAKIMQIRAATCQLPTVVEWAQVP